MKYDLNSMDRGHCHREIDAATGKPTGPSKKITKTKKNRLKGMAVGSYLNKVFVIWAERRSNSRTWLYYYLFEK